MAIKFTIGKKNEETIEAQNEEEIAPPIKVELQISKLLNNDYYVSSHFLIDIIIQRQNRKVLALPKNILTDQAYEVENRLFEFLGKHGVIDISTIQGGNIYGSLEAVILGDDAAVSDQALILTLKNFIDEERPLQDLENDIEREREMRLLLPDDDESTELGEVPHHKIKGTMPADTSNYTDGGYFFESLKKEK